MIAAEDPCHVADPSASGSSQLEVDIGRVRCMLAERAWC
jgi:hypothetical protein